MSNNFYLFTCTANLIKAVNMIFNHLKWSSFTATEKFCVAVICNLSFILMDVLAGNLFVYFGLTMGVGGVMWHVHDIQI